MTAPYDPRARADLTKSVRHVHEVWAFDKDSPIYNPTKLDLVNATINYDENRAPLVSLNGSMQVPTDTTLDFLDPRKNVRLFVLAGYVYDDGRRDIQKVCELGLRERIVRRPQNDMVLAAASDEMRVQDAVSTETYTFSSNDDGGTAIRHLIQDALGDVPVQVTVTRRAFVDPGDNLILEPGGSIWDMIQTIADRIGAWVYHDGLGVFHVVAQPTASGSAEATLRVGDGGTIKGSESVLGSEAFANFVMVEYTGGDLPVRGWAEVKEGDYGTTAIGRRAKVVKLETTGTVAQAEGAATAMLWRAMSRGRSMSLEVAQAMYWLRPGHTATVQLPTGPQERHLVASVEFDIPIGTMNIKTRQPENVAITTGE